MLSRTFVPLTYICTGLSDLVSASATSSSPSFFRYVDEGSASSYVKALSDLASYIAAAGPFDGVMAFSEGAAVAAGLLIQHIHQPRGSTPPFRFAIFFSGGIPADPGPLNLAANDFSAKNEDGNMSSRAERPMDFEHDGEVIDVPSAHIWGSSDDIYPDFGPVLCKLCTKDQRSVFVHRGGHEIPRSGDEVKKAVKIIEKTIDRALMAQ